MFQKLKRQIKNKKGFTLAELCVVMFISGIVGTMVVSSMLFFTKQQNEIVSEASQISELKDTQKIINDWLRNYDNNNFVISCSEDSTALIVKSGGAEQSRIVFENSAVTEVKGAEHSAKSDKFKNISRISFSLSQDSKTNMLKVTVITKAGQKEESHLLLFALFSGLKRDRQVTGKA